MAILIFNYTIPKNYMNINNKSIISLLYLINPVLI